MTHCIFFCAVERPNSVNILNILKTLGSYSRHVRCFCVWIQRPEVLWKAPLELKISGLCFGTSGLWSCDGRQAICWEELWGGKPGCLSGKEEVKIALMFMWKNPVLRCFDHLLDGLMVVLFFYVWDVLRPLNSSTRSKTLSCESSL